MLLPVALLATSPVSARETLQLHAVVGFNDTFRPGRWTPVTVTVSNQGPEVDGQLEVITSGGDAFRDQLFQTTHQRRLELSGNARKRFHFTVLPESLAHPLIVRVRTPAGVIAQQQIDLRERFTAERLLLVVSRDADLDYLNDARGTGLRVLYPHPELLPEHWRGYDAVAAMIVHDVSLENLSARQHEALRKWIAAGGTLAIAGGPDHASLRSARLAALLPATPAGMSTIADTAAVGAALGLDLASAAPILVHRVSELRGEVLASADGVPLLMARPWGQGTVLYLSFDVARRPFDRTSGMADLWSRMLHLSAVDAPGARTPRPLSPVPELIATQTRGLPGHGTALLSMGLYLALLLTGYRMPLRPGRARRLLAFATWAAPLVFAPAAYLVFGPLLFPRGASAAVLALVEPLGASPYARVHLDLGVYANRHGQLRLEYEGLEPTLHAPAGIRHGAAPVHWQFGEDAQRSALPRDSRAFVLHLLEGQDVINFDIDAAVHRDDAAARLTVRNDSGRALDDAWLIWNGDAWPIGRIDGDARIEHLLDTDPVMLDSRGAHWWDVLARQRGNDALRHASLRRLFTRTAARHEPGDYPGDGHALLLAHTSSPLRTAGQGSSWQHTSRALVLFRFAAPPAPGSADARGGGIDER